MRRFAAVFSSKRDKSASDNSSPPASKKPKRSNTVVKSATISQFSNDSAPPTPQLSAPSQSSSSSSGSASVSLQTPEPDDDLVLSQTPKSKSWMSWLGKKSGTIKVQPVPPPLPVWRPSPPPLLRSPPPPSRKPVITSSSHSEEDDETASLPATADSTPVSAPPVHALQILAQNALRHRTCPSPFVVQPETPLYPRSCNTHRSLSIRGSLGSDVLKANLLRRLQDTGTPFTPSEAASISSFRPKHPPTLMPLDTVSVDEIAPSMSSHVSRFSLGLHRWVSRPCFEDRYLVWTPVEERIVCHPVSGTSFGVAELEYSDALQAMVHSDLPQPSMQEELYAPDEADPSPSLPSDAETSPSSSASDLSTPHNRHFSYIGNPSPLREEHNTIERATAEPPSEDDVSPDADGEASSSPPPLSASRNGTVKRGVRFAEDDKEDTIPIGYALRIKKHREEKARFLREERERRLFEEERAKVEAERRKREQERMEWEKERRAWEKEKLAMEEEKRQRLYAEEVAAARLRRESQRMGARGTLTSTSMTSLKDSEHPKANTRRYSRPVYDSATMPRRQASEPAVLPSSPSHTPSPHSSSPSSSRPPSIASHSPVQSNGHLTPTSHPRTPSIRSASSEDMQSKKTSAARKRHSMASTSSSHQPTIDLMAAYPMWSANSMPPMPPVMPYAFDMPLLPPTAPFMLHQYPRPRSNRSSPAHSNSSSRNNSTDRVNQVRHPRQSSASPSRIPSHRTSDQRRSSGDGAQNSSPNDRDRSSSATSRSQPSSHSRGRPPLAPSSYSQPIPWTALPSQYSHPPIAMPQSGFGKRESMPAPRRGNTTS